MPPRRWLRHIGFHWLRHFITPRRHLPRRFRYFRRHSLFSFYFAFGDARHDIFFHFAFAATPMPPLFSCRLRHDYFRATPLRHYAISFHAAIRLFFVFASHYFAIFICFILTPLIAPFSLPFDDIAPDAFAAAFAMLIFRRCFITIVIRHCRLIFRFSIAIAIDAYWAAIFAAITTLRIHSPLRQRHYAADITPAYATPFSPLRFRQLSHCCRHFDYCYYAIYAIISHWHFAITCRQIYLILFTLIFTYAICYLRLIDTLMLLPCARRQRRWCRQRFCRRCHYAMRAERARAFFAERWFLAFINSHLATIDD